MKKDRSLSQGYIALSMILLLSVIIIAVSTTVTFLAIGEAQSGLTLSKGEDNLSFAEGCAEDALLKARASATYNGGDITRPGTEGTCTVSAITKVAGQWTFTVNKKTVTDYVRKIQVVTNYDGYGDTIVTWQEQ